jgi:molecular chaperone DnaJ
MGKLEKTHYQVLEVDPHVSVAEIKRAYRRLVKMQHPDVHEHKPAGSTGAATEEILRLNEAYATLKDTTRRAEYDVRIGVKTAIRLYDPRAIRLEDEESRARFLGAVFDPTRSAIARVLGMYKRQTRLLAADPYDDVLIEAFQTYVERIESTLRRGSQSLSAADVPPSLAPAAQMMRHAIAHASDGLDDLKQYCLNYDYNHLVMAENLFRIAGDLLRQAQGLARPR